MVCRAVLAANQDSYGIQNEKPVKEEKREKEKEKRRGGKEGEREHRQRAAKVVRGLEEELCLPNQNSGESSCLFF